MGRCVIKRDYHHFTLVDAVRDVEELVSSVRVKKQREDAEFITGRGLIRVALLELLKNYGLEPKYQLGNDGVIVCVIE